MLSLRAAGLHAMPHRLETVEVKIGVLWCLIHKPAGDVPKPWPLLVFLHGAGEVGPPDGSELHKAGRHGPWRSLGAGRFFILAPQCPVGSVWPALADKVVALTRSVCRRYVDINPKARCITGLSMGAFGAWAAASKAPSVFQTVISVCGGYASPMGSKTRLRDVVHLAQRDLTAADVARVKQKRAWLLHGSNDPRVSVKGSKELYKRLGGSSRGKQNLRLTVYPGMGHACWGRAYRTPGLLKWVAPSIPSRKRKHAA